MKLIITLITASIFFSNNSFSQQSEPTEAPTKQDYLTKSKNQKVAGFVLLGAGLTTLAIISKGKTSFDVLPALAIGGTVCTLASIPLFIASGRNKRKAANASAYLNMQDTENTLYAGTGLRVFPAVSIKLRLRH